MPKKSSEWEAECKAEWVKAWFRWTGDPPPMLDEPVWLDIVVIADRPKRLRRKSDPTHRIRATGKPDLDNVAKLVMDAMTKAGIVTDDTKVCGLSVHRWWQATDRPDPACVEIHLAREGR
jgi:Holliday junction resolvase RusA-like endonuclease